MDLELLTSSKRVRTQLQIAGLLIVFRLKLHNWLLRVVQFREYGPWNSQLRELQDLVATVNEITQENPNWQ